MVEQGRGGSDWGHGAAGRIDKESRLAVEEFDGGYFADLWYGWEPEEVPCYHLG